MSLAKVKYPFARARLKVGFESQDVTTAVIGESFDRLDKENNGAPQSVLLVVTGDFTTAGGASGDEVDVTVTCVDGSTSSPTDEHLAETYSFVVNADDEKKAFSVALPVPIHDAAKYVAGKVLVAAGTGAPTLSSANAAVSYLFGSNTDSRIQNKSGTGAEADTAQADMVTA